MAGRRKAAKGRERGIGTTIIAALLIGLFTGLGVGPLLFLAARVLPTTESVVTVTGRSRVESQGYYPFRPVRLSDDRYSYFVTVQHDNGATREIVAPRALYDIALPGLASLSTVSLEESVLLRVPVSVAFTSTFAGPDAVAERYSLLIPLTGILISIVFAFGIAGYLVWRILQQPNINRPVLFAVIGLCTALGAWVWL